MQKFLSKSASVPTTVGTNEGKIATYSHRIDLASCTAKSLIDDTLKGVSDDNRMKTLNTLQNLVQESSSYLSELVKMESKRIVIDCSNVEVKTTTDNADGTLYVAPEASFTEPRGKFSATLRSNGILIDGKSGNCFLPWTQVGSLIALPNPSTTKKDGEMLLFFILNKPIAWGKRQLKVLCWNLSQAKSTNELQVSYGPLHFKGTEANVVSSLSATLGSTPLVTPDNAIFRTSKGKSFLKCYKGVQEGTLYPLKEGVLFFKPPLFIPSNEVASIMAGRGGSAQTRYIDLNIDTEDNKSFEFSNIDRDDLPAIQQYVQYYVDLRQREEKKRLKKESEKGTNGGAVDLVDNDDDSDSESDEDFDPNRGDTDSSSSDDDDDEGSAYGEGSDDSDDDSNAADSVQNNGKMGGKKSKKAHGSTKVASSSGSKWTKEVQEVHSEGDDDDDDCDDDDDDEESNDESDDEFEACSGDELDQLRADLTEQESEAVSGSKRKRS